jgi:multimeric flavodoxin WrbA
MTSKKSPNPLIIFGSSRSDGHTFKAIQAVIEEKPIPILDLRNLSISHYDYNYENSKDDFIAVAEKMVQYDPIILATPVYWYTMSAIMKTFIDRWSDLLAIRKDLGKKLKDKSLYVITSYGTTIPRGFEEAFAQTCEYMNMRYKSCYYYYSGDNPELRKENALQAELFAQRIFSESI